MRVSLFLPTLNAQPILSEVLAAIDSQRGAQDLERVAIDSGSTDGTVACLKEHGFEVHRIDRAEFGHGTTRDLGLKRTQGDVVVLLTQDATPANPEWLSNLVAAFEDPRVAAAYSRQLPRADCNPFIAKRLDEWAASREQSAIQELLPGETLADLAPFDRLFRCAYDNVSGAVRKSVWEQLRFGPCRSGEDVVFGKKVIEAGHRIRYCSESFVLHSHRRTPRQEGKRTYCDHQVLSEHFGIRTIESFDSFRSSVRESRMAYAKAISEMQLPDSDRTELSKWARGYAFWTALGTWLGGCSEEHVRGPLGPLFRRIDRWMHR